MSNKKSDTLQAETAIYSVHIGDEIVSVEATSLEEAIELATGGVKPKREIK
jgi:hypothetical protein